MPNYRWWEQDFFLTSINEYFSNFSLMNIFFFYSLEN